MLDGRRITQSFPDKIFDVSTVRGRQNIGLAESDIAAYWARRDFEILLKVPSLEQNQGHILGFWNVGNLGLPTGRKVSADEVFRLASQAALVSLFDNVAQAYDSRLAPAPRQKETRRRIILSTDGSRTEGHFIAPPNPIPTLDPILTFERSCCSDTAKTAQTLLDRLHSNKDDARLFWVYWRACARGLRQDHDVGTTEVWRGDWCLMLVQPRANQRTRTLRSVDMFEVHIKPKPYTAVNLGNLNNLKSQQLTWSPDSPVDTLEGGKFNLTNLITIPAVVTDSADSNCSTIRLNDEKLHIQLPPTSCRDVPAFLVSSLLPTLHIFRDLLHHNRISFENHLKRCGLTTAPLQALTRRLQNVDGGPNPASTWVGKTIYNWRPGWELRTRGTITRYSVAEVPPNSPSDPGEFARPVYHVDYDDNDREDLEESEV